MVRRPLAMYLMALPLACDAGTAEPDDVCPRAGAAFELTLSAAEGPLPKDTLLEVTFGGNSTERYSARHGNDGNEAVCCVNGDGRNVSFNPATCGQSPTQEAGVGPKHDEGVLRCQLWTNGAAEVSVTASGFAPLEMTLVAYEDDDWPNCEAWERRPVELVLYPGDAGVAMP